LEAILQLSPSLDKPPEPAGERERERFFFPFSPPANSCVTNRRPISVDELITTHPINPPFRAAILQSGQVPIYGKVNNDTVSWDTLAERLNCSTQPDVLKCMRAANATTIVSIIEHLNLPFTAVKDNITELQNPELARKSGNIARVPILAGTTAQEGRVFGERQPLFSVPLFSLFFFFQQATISDALLTHYHLLLLTFFSSTRIRPRQYDHGVDGVGG
jgi:Carboxylesterase family